MASSSWTEFYFDATNGAHTNSGDRAGGSTDLANTGGSWISSTRVFTCSGSPDLSGIAADGTRFAQVYVDGATTFTCTGRITAVDNSAKTITLHATAVMGSYPTDGGGNRSIKIGGALRGPDSNSATNFSLASLTGNVTNASSHRPCFNFKAGTYLLPAANITNAGVLFGLAGYTSTVRDGGRATFDYGTNNNTLTFSGNGQHIQDLKVCTTASSGGATLLALSGISTWEGLVVNGARGNGITITQGHLSRSEIYDCNKNGTAGAGGVNLTGACTIESVISHSHSNATNGIGFLSGSGSGSLIGCIAHNNGSDGLQIGTSSGALNVRDCDFYYNGRDGIRVTHNGAIYLCVENSNFVRNTGWGLNKTGTSTYTFIVRNCAFGGGATYANGSGTVNLGQHAIESNLVNYTTHPYNSPDAGDFRLVSSQAINAGIGSFLQTHPSYSGSVGYPDIGAAQHLEAAAGGMLIHPGMGGGFRG